MIQAIGQNFQFDDGIGMVAEVSTWEDNQAIIPVNIPVYLGLPPLPVTVTPRIITFLVGDPNLNLHLPQLLGGGTTQGISRMLQNNQNNHPSESNHLLRMGAWNQNTMRLVSVMKDTMGHPIWQYDDWMPRGYTATRYFLYSPRHPKSFKYLVTRCLEPLKAFSGDIWRFKHLLTRCLDV